jgi:hypothetical protein
MEDEVMQIAIISTALAIVLFLCGFFAYKKLMDEINSACSFFAKFAGSNEAKMDWLKTEMSCEIQKHQDKTVEAQQKLYEYMDLTRKESLDSYRRGLQDGISAAAQKPIYAPQNPVKTMDEHVTEVKESKEQAEANKSFTDGFNSIMSYTGDLKGE